jgi:hypothetical protein
VLICADENNKIRFKTPLSENDYQEPSELIHVVFASNEKILQNIKSFWDMSSLIEMIKDMVRLLGIMIEDAWSMIRRLFKN